jgi:hypothetical protein
LIELIQSASSFEIPSQLVVSFISSDFTFFESFFSILNDNISTCPELTLDYCFCNFQITFEQTLSHTLAIYSELFSLLESKFEEQTSNLLIREILYPQFLLASKKGQFIPIIQIAIQKIFDVIMGNSYSSFKLLILSLFMKLPSIENQSHLTELSKRKKFPLIFSIQDLSILEDIFMISTHFGFTNYQKMLYKNDFTPFYSLLPFSTLNKNQTKSSFTPLFGEMSSLSKLSQTYDKAEIFYSFLMYKQQRNLSFEQARIQYGEKFTKVPQDLFQKLVLSECFQTTEKIFKIMINLNHQNFIISEYHDILFKLNEIIPIAFHGLFSSSLYDFKDPSSKLEFILDQFFVKYAAPPEFHFSFLIVLLNHFSIQSKEISVIQKRFTNALFSFQNEMFKEMTKEKNEIISKYLVKYLFYSKKIFDYSLSDGIGTGLALITNFYRQLHIFLGDLWKENWIYFFISRLALNPNFNLVLLFLILDSLFDINSFGNESILNSLDIGFNFFKIQILQIVIKDQYLSSFFLNKKFGKKFCSKYLKINWL